MKKNKIKKLSVIIFTLLGASLVLLSLFYQQNENSVEDTSANTGTTAVPASTQAICSNGICEEGEANTLDCSTSCLPGTNFCSSQPCTLKPGTCNEDCSTDPVVTVQCGALDIDQNGNLNLIDYFKFTEIYGSACSDSPFRDNFCNGKDTNDDGEINLLDFLDFVNRYAGSSC